MMPTLPVTGASARTTYTGSKQTLRMSEWAAANPASESRITSCGSLISFFMCVPPMMHARPLELADAREFDRDGGVHVAGHSLHGPRRWHQAVQPLRPRTTTERSNEHL